MCLGAVASQGVVVAFKLETQLRHEGGHSEQQGMPALGMSSVLFCKFQASFNCNTS